MVDSDFALALSLQKELYNELSTGTKTESGRISTILAGSSKKPHKSKSRSVVDPDWELIDPNPNVLAMFQEFNKTYFWGELNMVEVKWSKRMTLCAGLCRYEGFGGLCSIALSEPLLKLRPRKDLVETLLHEMIHAYLFVTRNNKDHDGHGPEFCKHMTRINQIAGSNITIYHSFHDEVAEHRKHWWRCQGPCQVRPPFYGYVKRAMNRAPSSRDFWWNEHERTCGGKYIKIKEPEDYKKKEQKKSITKTNTKNVSQIPNKQRIPSKSKPKSTNGASSSGSGNTIGHILGGSKTVNISGRGIPSASRLLSTQSSNVPPPFIKKSDIKKEEEVTIKTKDVHHKRVNFFRSRKREIHSNDSPVKTKKKKTNLYDFLQRMRKSGRKSVNEGAPAFRSIKPVVSFSKRAVLFDDIDDEVSNKENNTCSQTTSTSLLRDVRSNRENISKKLKDTKGCRDNARDEMNDGVLFDEFDSVSNVANSGKTSTSSAGEDALKIKTEMNSEKLTGSGVGGDGLVKVKKEIPVTRGFSSSDLDDGLDGGLLRIRSKKPRNRLPSFSDDDDETLTQVWQSHINTKKGKFDSSLENAENCVSTFTIKSEEKVLDQKCNKPAAESCPMTSVDDISSKKHNGTSPESISQFRDNNHCEKDAESCLFEDDGASLNVNTHTIDSISHDTSTAGSPESSQVSCPICGVMCTSENIIQHVDDCLTSGESQDKSNNTAPHLSKETVTTCSSPVTPSTSNCDSPNLNETSAISHNGKNSESNNESNCVPGTSSICANGAESSHVSCPICGMLCPVENINGHVDECLSLKTINEADWD